MNKREIFHDIENFHPPGGLPSLFIYRYNKGKIPRYGWHHTGALPTQIQKIRVGTIIIYCPAEKRKD